MHLFISHPSIHHSIDKCELSVLAFNTFEWLNSGLLFFYEKLVLFWSMGGWWWHHHNHSRHTHITITTTLLTQLQTYCPAYHFAALLFLPIITTTHPTTFFFKKAMQKFAFYT